MRGCIQKVGIRLVKRLENKDKNKNKSQAQQLKVYQHLSVNLKQNFTQANGREKTCNYFHLSI